MKEFLKKVLISSGFFLLVLFLILVAPILLRNFSNNQQPVSDYNTALSRVKDFDVKEESVLNPVCHSQVLTHGQKTQKVIVLIHGFTTCPRMYHILATEFYDKGYNVFIPRQPHHGAKDVLTEDLKNLRAEDLAHFSDEVANISHGLGEEVTIFGLSSGAVVASYIAQEREDIDKVIIVAPSLAATEDHFITRMYINAITTAPNFFLWWDQKAKEKVKRPLYSYPRFSTRALGEVYKLGYLVFQKAENNKPKAKKIILVSNDNDMAINNKVTDQLYEKWKQVGADVSLKTIGKKYKLTHDLISPEQSKQRIKISYPLLSTIIESE